MGDQQTHDFDTHDNAPVPGTPTAWSSYVLILLTVVAVALTLAAFARGNNGWGIAGLIASVVLAIAAAPLIIRSGRRALSGHDGHNRNLHPNK